MKIRTNIYPMTMGVSMAIASLQAADVVKDGNTTSLVNGSSWVGGSAPTNGDIAVFNDVFTSTNNLGTGAGLPYLGIRIEGSHGSLITINNTTYNNFVSTGLSGIDMLSATRDFKLVGYVADGDQTWGVASGRTLTLGGTRFSGTGNINITGAGTTIINADTGSGVYSGTLSVSGGILQLNALEGGEVLVNDGGTLAGEIALPGNLTLGSTGGATLLMDASTAGSLATNNLELVGLNTVELNNQPTGAGTHDVVAYSGALVGTVANLQLAGASNYRNAPSFADTGSAITLSFVAGDSLTWTGATDGNWDINATQNWNNGAATNFFNLDSVTFDDTGANKDVNLVSEVAPVSLTVNNSAGNDYSFSGMAITGSGGLTKSGEGTLTILNDNSYTGSVSIQNGVVQVGNGGTTGVIGGSGDISVSAAATLDYNRSDAVNIGRRVIGGGELIYNGSGSLRTGQAGNNVDITVNSGTFEAVDGGWASSYFSTANRLITVNNGAELLTDTHGLGGLGGTFRRPDIVINEGGTWTVNGGQYMNAGDLTLNGGTINVTSTNLRLQGGTMTVGASTGGSTVSGLNMTLYASPTFNVADGAAADDFVVSSIVNESGSGRNLTKTGAGTMRLDAINTYTGTTTIADGMLSLGVSGSIAMSSLIDVHDGASLNVSALTGGFELAGGQTLTGPGSVIGPIQMAGGSVLSPGAGLGTMDFSGDVSMASTAIMMIDITGTGPTEFDIILGDGVADGDTLTLGGTLDLNLDGGYTAMAGDEFQIFQEWDTITGSFSSITGADIGPSLEWDMSTLNSDGTLRIAAIPEPSSLALMGLGGVALLLRRRR